MCGVQLALSRAPIPAAYFEAVTGSEAEADDLEYRTNVKRAESRAMAKAGW